MVCGGNVDIFLEPLCERHKGLYDMIEVLEHRGKRAIVVTKFGKDRFSKSLVDAYGGRWGDPMEEEEIEGYRQFFFDKMPRVLDNGVVIEPLRIASTLYIFGAATYPGILLKQPKWSISMWSS